MTLGAAYALGCISGAIGLIVIVLVACAGQDWAEQRERRQERLIRKLAQDEIAKSNERFP